MPSCLAVLNVPRGEIPLVAAPSFLVPLLFVSLFLLSLFMAAVTAAAAARCHDPVSLCGIGDGGVVIVGAFIGFLVNVLAGFVMALIGVYV